MQVHHTSERGNREASSEVLGEIGANETPHHLVPRAHWQHARTHEETLSRWQSRKQPVFRDANGGGFSGSPDGGRADPTFLQWVSHGARRLAPLLFLFCCQSFMARGAERQLG